MKLNKRFEKNISRYKYNEYLDYSTDECENTFYNLFEKNTSKIQNSNYLRLYLNLFIIWSYIPIKSLKRTWMNI